MSLYYTKLKEHCLQSTSHLFNIPKENFPQSLLDSVMIETIKTFIKENHPKMSEAILSAKAMNILQQSRKKTPNKETKDILDTILSSNVNNPQTQKSDYDILYETFYDGFKQNFQKQFGNDKNPPQPMVDLLFRKAIITHYEQELPKRNLPINVSAEQMADAFLEVAKSSRKPNGWQSEFNEILQKIHALNLVLNTKNSSTEKTSSTNAIDKFVYGIGKGVKNVKKTIKESEVVNKFTSWFRNLSTYDDVVQEKLNTVNTHIKQATDRFKNLGLILGQDIESEPYSFQIISFKQGLVGLFGEDSEKNVLIQILATLQKHISKKYPNLPDSQLTDKAIEIFEKGTQHNLPQTYKNILKDTLEELRNTTIQILQKSFKHNKENKSIPLKSTKSKEMFDNYDTKQDEPVDIVLLVICAFIIIMIFWAAMS